MLEELLESFMVLALLAAAMIGLPPMTNVDVAGVLVEQARFRPKDSFDAPPDKSQWAGRPFKVDVQVLQLGSDSNGFGGWSYDADAQVLTLTAEPDTASFEWKGKVPGYSAIGYYLGTNKRRVGSRVGRTEMGISKRVTSYTWTGLMIGEFTGDNADLRYSAKLPISSDAARLLVPNLMLSIEGVIVKIGERSVAVCGDDQNGATLSDPTEEYDFACMMNVHVSKINFYDRRTKLSVGMPLDRNVVTTQTADAPSSVGVIANPLWVRRPSADDFARYFPPRAQALGKEGHASMRCIVTDSGTVTECKILSETPSDMGFGDATLRLSKLFKMNPTTDDGRSVGGSEVTIGINFRLVH